MLSVKAVILSLFCEESDPLTFSSFMGYSE